MAQKNVKEVAKASLAELAKRVPPHHSLQFQAFQSKHADYQKRVNKLPEKLPSIDWEFYRLNVRSESQKWVDEFKEKYKAIIETFDARAKQDYSKYYTELEKARIEMKEEIEKFKSKSNERIQMLESEYENLKALIPYDQMTAEEYVDLLPEKSAFMYEGRPTFWPHTPEEQSLEPPKMGHHNGDDHHGDSGGDAKKAKDDHGDQGKAPKGDDGPTGSTGDSGPASASSTPSKAGGGDSKDKPMKSKSDEKSAKSLDKAKLVQNMPASKPKRSVTFKDTVEEKTIRDEKRDFTDKLVEELEGAFVYDPITDVKVVKVQKGIEKK